MDRNELPWLVVDVLAVSHVGDLPFGIAVLEVDLDAI